MTAPENLDAALRPKTLAEYVGQERLKDKLGVYLQAARGRREALDHTLLFGPPGLGKTTLAHIIAYELGVNIRVTSGPAIEKPGDLAAILTNSLEEGDVLFIDEIHRLGRVAEEHLYPAMEDFKLDIVLGQGPAARTIELPLPRFTLVGATTRNGGPPGSRSRAWDTRDSTWSVLPSPMSSARMPPRSCSHSRVSQRTPSSW